MERFLGGEAEKPCFSKDTWILSRLIPTLGSTLGYLLGITRFNLPGIQLLVSILVKEILI